MKKIASMDVGKVGFHNSKMVEGFNDFRDSVMGVMTWTSMDGKCEECQQPNGENQKPGDETRNLNWEERLLIALDVSHGIEYLHDGAVPSVIHRDLKSANILLDKSMRAKVADFGLSKEEVFDGRYSGLKGTYGYMDPDYVSTNNYTKKSDIYSFARSPKPPLTVGPVAVHCLWNGEATMFYHTKAISK